MAAKGVPPRVEEEGGQTHGARCPTRCTRYPASFTQESQMYDMMSLTNPPGRTWQSTLLVLVRVVAQQVRAECRIGGCCG